MEFEVFDSCLVFAVVWEFNFDLVLALVVSGVSFFFWFCW